jgi:hypothetical protein
MKKNIEFIINRNLGWGFQEAQLTYDTPIDMLVLPCSWFDPDWLHNPYPIKGNIFNETNKSYDFENFFKGSFCYHWHNKWNHPVHPSSIIKQLVTIIQNNL